MASEVLRIQSCAEAVVADLRQGVLTPDSVAVVVARIIDAVRAEGDGGVERYTREFDTSGQPPPALRVSPQELEQAGTGLDGALSQAVHAAYRNVHETARAGVMDAVTTADDAERRITVREEPVRRAAIYVPGGRAPYPSTVVMGVAAARAAEVRDVLVCSPPPVDPVILGACAELGVTEVYRMGGAQAVAALAHGTETVPRVDLIVGPGNVYVQEAKRQVSAVVGIDGFAGPSDLVVIVEEDVPDLEPIALDLLAQAEHGEGTLVVAVSTSEAVLGRLGSRLRDAPDTGAVIRLALALTIGDALEFAQAFAPEHLQLAGAQAEALAPRITNAGCLFVGAHSATAFGDYIVGSNHVLPTNGSARFSSGLSAAQLRRRFAEVRILDPEAMARVAAPLARAEGFELHAQSMEARIRDNRPG